MNRLMILYSMCLLLALESCAVKYEIVSDRDDKAVFEKYKTYTIIHDDHGFEIGTNPLNKVRIDKAIESEMEDIGYEYSINPDLEVSWFIKVDTELEQGIYNAYYSKWRTPMPIDVHEYQVGSLVVDIIDVQSGKVVWHVKLSGKVEDELPEIERKINKAVKQIFNAYKKDTGVKKIKAYAIE